MNAPHNISITEVARTLAQLPQATTRALLSQTRVAHGNRARAFRQQSIFCEYRRPHQRSCSHIERRTQLRPYWRLNTSEFGSVSDIEEARIESLA